MRDGWRQVTLGELADIVKGTSPIQKTRPGAYPLIVTGAEPTSSEEYQFEGEAVCVPMVSSTGHGHASLKRVHYATGRFAVANIISACIVREPTALSTRYLHLYLQHYKDDLIVPRMKGTANVSLSVGRLAEVPIAVPPLAEQRRIVDLITAVDHSIEAAEAEAASHAGGLAATLDKHLADGGNLQPLSELALSPRGLIGGPFGSSLVRADYRAEGVPVIRGANMPRSGARDVGGDFVYVTHEKAEMLARNQAVAGDVIFTQRGTIGQVGIVPDEAHERYVISQSQMRLRVDPSLATPDYVRMVFTAPSMVAKLKSQDRATANPHINLGVLADTRIPVPSVEVQESLVAIWISWERAAESARAAIYALQVLRRNLLTVLLSGEHEIPASYDRLLEEAA